MNFDDYVASFGKFQFLGRDENSALESRSYSARLGGFRRSPAGIRFADFRDRRRHSIESGVRERIRIAILLAPHMLNCEVRKLPGQLHCAFVQGL